MSVYHNGKYPRRGEIYYVKKGGTTSTGSETWSNRHAVIVSADYMNKRASVVEVVYITTQDKNETPTHVDISTPTIQRTILCEQIVAVDKTRIVEYKGRLSKKQMEQIDKSLAWNLDLFRYLGNNRVDNSP